MQMRRLINPSASLHKDRTACCRRPLIKKQYDDTPGEEPSVLSLLEVQIGTGCGAYQLIRK